MGFTSDACWFWLIKTLVIENNKNREAALKNEAGVFLLGLTAASLVKFSSSPLSFEYIPGCQKYRSENCEKDPRLLRKENFREPFGLPKIKVGSPSHNLRSPKLISD